MLWSIGKVLISAIMISLTSWMAGKKPGLAGFLLALPLASMLALAFSYAEFKDPQQSVSFAKSILTAVPLSLVFFVPFLFAERLKLPFPLLYALGLLLLTGAYFFHRYVFDT